MITKICTVCNQHKLLEEYYNRKASEDGKAYRCKECDNKAVKDYRKRNPQRWKTKARNSQLRMKFGIEPEDYNKILVSQNHMCAICGTESFNNQHPRLVVDHDHVTNKLRGLLCHKCNQGLGLFKDSYENLLKAARYLKIHVGK